MSDQDSSSLNGPACYRERTVGVYKTFSPGELVPLEEKWLFIHSGPCQCEGKSAPDCIEPGDDN